MFYLQKYRIGTFAELEMFINKTPIRVINQASSLLFKNNGKTNSKKPSKNQPKITTTIIVTNDFKIFFVALIFIPIVIKY